MGEVEKIIKTFTKGEIEGYADSLVSDFEDMTTEQLQWFFKRMIYHAQEHCKDITALRVDKEDDKD